MKNYMFFIDKFLDLRSDIETLQNQISDPNIKTRLEEAKRLIEDINREFDHGHDDSEVIANFDKERQEQWQ